MFWMPSEIVPTPPAQACGTTASGTQSRENTDTAWGAWGDLMREYSEASNSMGLPRLNFWLVVSLPGDSYSDKLEWHSEIPMLMPSSGTGTLLGLAKTKSELDEMMFEDSRGTDGDPGNVHLTYKVKIQGQKAWRDLLKFLAEHGMLEKE